MSSRPQARRGAAAAAALLARVTNAGAFICFYYVDSRLRVSAVTVSSSHRRVRLTNHRATNCLCVRMVVGESRRCGRCRMLALTKLVAVSSVTSMNAVLL